MISPRGPLATRRMTAHWVVLAAAALTTLVAAALAAALAVFTAQVLPLAVQHDLVTAPGTGMSVTALVSSPGQATQGSAALRSRIAAAMPGVPFSFQEAFWSDPLGVIPGALPAAPASAGKGGAALLQAASMSGVTGQAVLVSGHWPAAPGGGQAAAIQAALPAAAAALLHVSAGDVLRLRDTVSQTVLTFDVTGLFAPRPADSYWSLSYIPASGMSASGAGSTTYGPLLVSEAAFGPALAVSSGSWTARPDLAAVGDGELNAMSASITTQSKSLLNASILGGAQLTTTLPALLSATATNLAVARSILVISALELLVLALAALLAVARLLVAQREEETALLIARGATRAQLTRLTAAEVVPLSVVTSVAGGIAGIRLVGLLAGAGPLGQAGIRLAGQAGTWLDALVAALVVALIAVAALLAPVATPSPGAVRARRGRQALLAGVARTGLDIALVVLAVLAGWQLRQYSALSDGGTAGIDPVLALAPALALAAGSVATLRLLPLAARATGGLAARGRGLTASLASWRFSRMPVRQGSAALLLVLAVATGTLAFAQHASWTRSASDQANFTAGGDVQVNPPAALAPGAVGALTAAPGVTHSMALAADIQATPGDVVAIGSAQAAPVVKLRPDESPLPAGSLFRALTPSSLPGAVLPAPPPGAPSGPIRFTATLDGVTPGAATGSSGGQLAAQLGPVTVTLTILDQSGAAYQVAAGPLAADGRPHALVASLGGDAARYPLRVAAITAAYLLPQHAAAAVTLTVSGLSLAGWTDNASAPDSGSLNLLPLFTDPSSGPAQVTGQTATFSFNTGFGAAYSGAVEPPTEPVPGRVVLLPTAAPVSAVPAIATKAFTDANSLTVGSVVPEYVNGTEVPMRITAVVTSFPTITSAGGALVTDLGGLEEYLVRQSVAPLPVTQWWLATAGGGVPPPVAAGVPAGTSIVSATGLATTTTTDPLSAAPQLGLLAMGVAAAFLAITGFWVSIAADVRQRRGETALLAALGVARRESAVQLGLEKLLLSLPSAVIGVVLGVAVARLLVPAVTLSPAAQQPVPPVITLYDLPLVIPVALAVAVLPALAAALAAVRRPDPAAALRAAEAA
ncbi:MAG TPA: ABC transporter permease [Trebonia sp.]|nr:ABC transporter permease [Trebonia sp.]